jgi:UMP-CMP kinase
MNGNLITPSYAIKFTVLWEPWLQTNLLATLRLFSLLVSYILILCLEAFANHSPGAPGAGKGTLCTHLAQKFDMMHYSVGDNLRSWMRNNRDSTLAVQIQKRLDNQGFLFSQDLNSFLYGAIDEAINSNNTKCRGIIIDGFPRCTEQLLSFATWPFQDKLPLAPSSDGQVKTDAKPDIVLSLETTQSKAKARYLGRGRDDNDSEEKFEKRFAEYELETSLVGETYRRRGILITVSTSGK